MVCFNLHLMILFFNAAEIFFFFQVIYNVQYSLCSTSQHAVGVSTIFDAYVVARFQRIHKEPGHEEDANAQQDDSQMWEYSWVDGAHITSHRLKSRHLKHKQFTGTLKYWDS